MQQCEISVIIPAYNEEEHIEYAVAEADVALRELGRSYEIVVVDDGSIDQTKQRIQNYAATNGHIKVVGYPTNMGKGHALKYGLSQTVGEKIILLDGDREINPNQIGVYLKALDEADIAIASRGHPQSQVKAPLTRRFLSRSFHLLAKLLVGVKVSDTQAGLKAFRRTALDSIFRMQTVKAYAFDVETFALVALLKLRVKELPVKMEIKGSIGLRSILRMFLDLLGIAYRLRVTRQYQRARMDKPVYEAESPI